MLAEEVPRFSTVEFVAADEFPELEPVAQMELVVETRRQRQAREA